MVNEFICAIINNIVVTLRLLTEKMKPQTLINRLISEFRTFVIIIFVVLLVWISN